MKLKKIVAGILSAVMIGASLCAVPASADSTKVKTIKLSSDYSREFGTIDVEKEGKLTLEVTTAGSVFASLMYSDFSGCNEKWTKVNIDGKDYSEEDFVLNEERSKDVGADVYILNP